MFTEKQLKAAHVKVKTGADFPRYIYEIKQMGLLRYEYLVANGSTIYYGDNGYKVVSENKYDLITIAATPSAEKLKHIITIHQQGHTDFMTFCRQAADSGVEKWEINTETMLCTYYDLTGDEIVAEPIPDGGY